MTTMNAKILDRGRSLVQTLRREGRRDDARTVDALLQAIVANESDPLLTTGQVAQRIGVSRQTVVNWVKKGLLPGIRLGGRTLISSAALAEFAQFESILDRLDAERKPATPEEAAEATARTHKGWTWRQ